MLSQGLDCPRSPPMRRHVKDVSIQGPRSKMPRAGEPSSIAAPPGIYLAFIYSTFKSTM